MFFWRGLKEAEFGANSAESLLFGRFLEAGELGRRADSAGKLGFGLSRIRAIFRVRTENDPCRVKADGIELNRHLSHDFFFKISFSQTDGLVETDSCVAIIDWPHDIFEDKFTHHNHSHY